ncbi:cell division protein FtsQ/DivIB [Herbaspirillum sp. RV1423]|uniref:cell division protein FtsQ/DivIB n=1 Tax=Herbaspirillum sp. RV1423 TaxID=1443993 RepID=UPI0004B84756|nr:cell division protein FtsQ/DivIB [Herbaspirillum sp. RV1423]
MWQDVKMLNAITNALLALVLLALLASGLWWLAQRPMFTLKTIRVEGVAESSLRRVNALTIRASAVPRIKGNFFTADLDAVRSAFESVPWVRKAMVRREWPNKLIVSIEEHRALGTWGDEGRLLSVKGDVFTANLAEAEDDGDLLEFDGPDGSEKEVVARFDQFRDWLAPIKVVPEAVALSNRYAWTVKLDNGITVELGRAESDATLKERIGRLVSVYPQLMERLQGKKIENVDMRYPNGLALKADGLVLAALNGKKK